MVMIEMRDAVYDTAFDLLDEAKLNAKKTKLTLCELENAMYDCYEASKEDHDGEEGSEEDMNFRGVTGYREDYRHDGDDEDEMSTKKHLGLRRRSRAMRMRRRLV